MTCVCMMVKAPRPGLVKTRLAQELGDPVAAVEIYRRLVARQIAQVPETWRLEVHFTPANAAQEMQEWLGPITEERANFFPQQGENLGSRMNAAVAAAIGRGAQRVLLIGGDCAELTRARLHIAEQKLTQHQVVIGPARDGGYVLLGLRQPQPELFRAISWSSADVLQQTLARAAECHLSVDLLEPMEDVDDLASWRRAEQLWECSAS